MDLLFSNYPPLRTAYSTYPKTFKSLLEEADAVQIATGYISSDSVIDLKRIIEVNHGPHVDLCIGMHFFEGLSPIQRDAVQLFDDTLRTNGLGQVHMVTTFPFHGKISSFSKNRNIIGSLIGSSNLSNIIDNCRQYEADVFFDEETKAKEISEFINRLIEVSSKPFHELEVPIVIPSNDLLQNQIGVSQVTDDEKNKIRLNLSTLTFEIPLKGDESQKSGLNASFGEGRRNPQGYIIPRPWYEVELIVPKSITSLPGYPQANSQDDSGTFDVITDDGWKFRCKVSGDFSKNFRSEDDLKILGKWIKGRLEKNGILKAGEKVSDQTLAIYGRTSITMTKIANGNSWYLDFSR